MLINMRINKFLLSIIIFLLIAGCENSFKVPAYLKDFQKEYKADPRNANLVWFKDAQYGMFIHYGLYSLLEKGEWVQFNDTIPVSEYAKLKDRFTADKFDPDFITDLALEAGMKYITITSKHHDGFCLFNTQATDFNSLNSVAKRDLIGELYEECREKGLGLFLYYSYAADWKHPYFYPREAGWSAARPPYPSPQPEYKYEDDKDFRKYIDFVHQQLTEILTQYPEIAGIWLDPINGFYHKPDLFPVEETYSLIRKLSPHALISFKQGANGSEDFIAPERKADAKTGQQLEIARKIYELNKLKHREVCNTLQPKITGIPGNTWGYNKHYDGKHRDADEVFTMLQDTRAMHSNLLLNIGPRGDGSFPEEDILTLQEVGKRLKQEEN